MTTHADSGLHGRAFRRAMGRLPTSVVVVCGVAAGVPVGMVVGTFTSVSLDPLLVGFFATRNSGTLPRLLESPVMTYSVLDQADETTVPAFMRPHDERFSIVKWTPGPEGAPELVGSVLTVRTRLHSVTDAGDHVLVLSEVHGITGGSPLSRPLVFFGGRMTRLDPGRLVDSEIWPLSFQE